MPRYYTCLKKPADQLRFPGLFYLHSRGCGQSLLGWSQTLLRGIVFVFLVHIFKQPTSLAVQIPNNFLLQFIYLFLAQQYQWRWISQMNLITNRASANTGAVADSVNLIRKINLIAELAVCFIECIPVLSFSFSKWQNTVFNNVAQPVSTVSFIIKSGNSYATCPSKLF